MRPDGVSAADVQGRVRVGETIAVCPSIYTTAGGRGRAGGDLGRHRSRGGQALGAWPLRRVPQAFFGRAPHGHEAPIVAIGRLLDEGDYAALVRNRSIASRMSLW